MSNTAAPKEALKTILYNCFIAPLCSRERAHIYASSLLASIGFALFEVYLSFDIAGQGLVPLLTFLITRYAISNFIGMPGGFLLLARFGAHRTFIGLLILQITVAVLASLNAQAAMPFWMYGLIASCTNVPFWVAYHTAMAMHTSGDNRGNEVVVADAGLKIGAVIGSVLGGVFLVFDASALAIILALVSTCGGTAMMITKLVKQKFIATPSTETPPTIRGIIFENPMRTFLTVMDGAVYNFTFMLTPIWLKFLGLGGMMVGLINGLSIILNILAAPFVGTMANRGDGREVAVGSGLSMLGWIPWAAFSSPLLLAGSYFFWSAGAQFTGLGLMCRWYEIRNVHALAAREILLGVGRIIAAATMLPILYVSFNHFAWAAIVMTTVLTATAIIARRRAAVQMT